MEYSAFAPATVANIACAFDVLGCALCQPGDKVTVSFNNSNTLKIKDVEGAATSLPTDPNLNTAGVAVAAFLRYMGITKGVDISIKKEMPLGSGLGSSAASAAAALVAINEACGTNLSRKELVQFAMEGERIACGSAHADNVAPALLGGVVLIRSYSPLDIVSLPYPDDLAMVVVHPHIEVRTSDARRILRKEVPLKDAIRQWANVAGLVAGLTTGDYALIGRSLDDAIIEPARAVLIPGFEEVKIAAIKAGALGCSISGAGPSIFALCRLQDRLEEISRVMVGQFDKIGIGATPYISEINKLGATLIT